MDKYWIWLSQIKGVGPVTQKKLIKKFKTPKGVYDAAEEELMLTEGISQSTVGAIKSSMSLDHANNIIENLTKIKAKLLTYDNPLYPQMVKEIPETPVVLYYQGNIRENSLGVAIVGARRCTNYGKEVTKEAAEFLAKYNIPVISGLAKGIDGYAHTACLKADGYTLAFLGCGIDICYPKEHQELMDRIKDCGAVISQFPPGIKANPLHFPQRNLLIATWSHKILVVEASEKSGSLITAQFAQKYNRQVLAVPNNIYLKESKGTNNLIAAGSQIYLHPNQLLIDKVFNKVSHKQPATRGRRIPPKQKPALNQPQDRLAKTKSRQFADTHTSSLEIAILNLLNNSPQTIEQLAAQLPNNSSFLETVSTMELEGKIETLPGGKIIKIN